MDRLLVGGQLQSMKLALILTAVEAETEEVVETGAAGGATNQLVFDPHVSSEGDLKSNQLEAHYNYAVGPLFYFVSASRQAIAICRQW